MKTAGLEIPMDVLRKCKDANILHKNEVKRKKRERAAESCDLRKRMKIKTEKLEEATEKNKRLEERINHYHVENLLDKYLGLFRVAQKSAEQ